MSWTMARSAAPEQPVKPHIPEIERRSVTLDAAEFRDTDDGALRFTGHAAVFDHWSEDLGGFRERIQRGAFRKALKDADVRLLLNHNPDFPMARTTVEDGPGSLRLSEDVKGLLVEAELVPTQAAEDLRKLMDAGVITQMSFGFSMRGGVDEWDETDDSVDRTIVEFGCLFDVSPVVFPAYPQTDAAMRSLMEQLATRVSAEGFTAEEAAVLSAAAERCIPDSPWVAELARRADESPEPTGKADTEEGEGTPDTPVGQWRLAARKRRLVVTQLQHSA